MCPTTSTTPTCTRPPERTRTRAARLTQLNSTLPLHLLLLAIAVGQLVDAVAAAPQPPEVPDFDEPIGNQTVAVGKDAQLSCKINNLGQFRTAWLRVEDKGILTIHNNIITRNYRIGLLNDENGKTFVLTIKNVQPADKGGYMCQINSVPMKYAIGYVDVLTPPVFEDAPPAAAAAATTTLVPLSNYQADSAAAPQQQQPPPQQQATLVTVGEGASAALTCKARGHPEPTIAWRREDGAPISLGAQPADESSPAKVDGPTLVFGAAHRHHAGAYLCIASNGVQPAASKRQVLDVQFAPVVTLPRKEVGARLGERHAQLECLVELNPLGSYHFVKLHSGGGARAQPTGDETGAAADEAARDELWLIEHDELIQSDKHEIVIKQATSEKVHMQLTIRQVERQDFGWYKCIARNSLGLQSNSVRLFEASAFSLDSMFGRPAAARDEPKPLAGGSSQRPAQQTRSSWIQRARDNQVPVGGGGGGGGGDDSLAPQSFPPQSSSAPSSSSSAATLLRENKLLCCWLTVGAQSLSTLLLLSKWRGTVFI